MKKIKKHIFKRNKNKSYFILYFLSLFFWVLAVFSNDIFYDIPYQIANNLGSNNSLIRFSHWDNTKYANKWADSSIIGNYFSGYYYDSVLWFFKLDWSSDEEDNIRIISSTTKCSSWYGYKLWGYAKSNYYGFMDFDYNNDIFVYYCEFDKSLHGYAYTKYNWFQRFDWIRFEILWKNSSINVFWTGVFVNDTTKIGVENYYTWSDSESLHNSLWWNIFNFDDTKDSLFYIIK
jgi:hypothetical protein